MIGGRREAALARSAVVVSGRTSLSDAGTVKQPAEPPERGRIKRIASDRMLFRRHPTEARCGGASEVSAAQAVRATPLERKEGAPLRRGRLLLCRAKSCALRPGKGRALIRSLPSACGESAVSPSASVGFLQRVRTLS